MKLIVETTDMLNALRAVGPHAYPKPDLPHVHRLRVDVTGENVHVSACNMLTAGHAIASRWEGDGEVGSFDLSPLDVKAITSIFQTKKKKTDDEPDAVLQFEVNDEHVIVTEVDGLFDGRSIQLARYPSEPRFPNVIRLLHAKFGLDQDKPGKAAKVVGGFDAVVLRQVWSGQLLGLFTKASAIYGEPLVIDPAPAAGGAALIACGESFLGLMPSPRQDDETLAKLNGWRLDWQPRLADLYAIQPEIPDAADDDEQDTDTDDEQS